MAPSLLQLAALRGAIALLHNANFASYEPPMDVEAVARQRRAFLRWAGGKSWLARQAEEIFGQLNFERYHEPFVGGGAFFFSLAGAPFAYLSDKNEALIEAYQCLKEDPDRVIGTMRLLKNTEQEYYRIRSQKPQCRYDRTAQFIFLNQTSFNGLYRVNLNGVYNVPYGYRTKDFLDETALIEAAHSLQNAVITARDFTEAIEFVQEGDLVFLDPPYTISHNNNGFIKYNQSLFSLHDQYRLAESIEIIRKRGAKYILTNAAHSKIREIFDLGDTCIELSRASLIGGRMAKRGSVQELLFTNLGVR